MAQWRSNGERSQLSRRGSSVPRNAYPASVRQETSAATEPRYGNMGHRRSVVLSAESWQPCFDNRKNALCAITITQPFCGGLPTEPRPRRPALDCVLSPTKSISSRRASTALGSLPDFRASGLPDFAGEFIGGPNFVRGCRG